VRILPFLLLCLLMAPTARAEIHHSRESGLRTAFPDADAFETRSVMLDADQVEAIRSTSGTHLPSRLVRIHVARRGDDVLGYGYLETHTVRTLPETILVAVDPRGHSQGVHLLAFHEPPQYAPPDPWLSQFEDRPLDPGLALRRGIAGISGSTLTAQSITATVRRILATHRAIHGAPRAVRSAAAPTAAGAP